MRIGGYHIGFAGTSHVREDDERHRAWRRIAEHIGAEVMRRGHRLVTGGCSGGLSQHCVESAKRWLEGHGQSSEQELRIISIVPEQIPPTVAVGRVLVCKSWSRDQRRAYMASLEDALITVAGVRGTLREGQCAFCMGTPVVPIYGTGGRTGDLWQQIRTEFSAHPLYEHLLGSPVWSTANAEHLLDPERTARVAVDFAVHMATRKTELHVRRASGAPAGVLKAFVLMPFKGFDDVYEKIRLAVSDAGRWVGHIECLRADEQLTGKLAESIFRDIEEAALLIVDLTGNNGNVLLEYGYGLALNKKAVLLHQRPEETLTDLKNQKQIPYGLDAGSLRSLQENVAYAICDVLGPHGAGALGRQGEPPRERQSCQAVQEGFACLFRDAWMKRTE